MDKVKCIICNRDGVEIVLNGLDLLKCYKCGLFWRRDFSLSDNHYKKQDFKLSPEKIKHRVLNAKDRIGTIKNYVDLNNLLDVGCGEGVFLKTLRDEGYNNLIGLEPGEMAQDFAKKNNLKIINGSIEDCGAVIEENNIDTITMFHVIEHLKDPADSLKNIYTKINKGSCLVIETPDMDSYLLKKLNYNHELIYPEHLYYFSKKNIKKLLENIGFKIVASGSRDFNPENMSIKDSLVRLGMLSIKTKVVTINEPKNKNDSSVIDNGGGNVIKGTVRSILSRLVYLLGRGNYFWVIARK